MDDYDPMETMEDAGPQVVVREVREARLPVKAFSKHS